VLDFKENAEKILEKEKTETLSLQDFSKAILDSRSFEISLQHNCIKLKCYITLEKDKDNNNNNVNSNSSSNNNSNNSLSSQNLNCNKKKISESSSGYSSLNHVRNESISSYHDSDSVFADQNNNFNQQQQQTIGSGSGGAKKVNVEVIMKSNPFRIDENEKTTRMELVRNDSFSNNNSNNGLLRFTYYVKPECEAKKMKDTTNNTSSGLYENGRLVVFTNDFFTVYQDRSTGEMNISLNEIG
jgi:hypothetical protein